MYSRLIKAGSENFINQIQATRNAPEGGNRIQNMKKNTILTRLISFIFITALLLYLMAASASPKIIFVPFLICSLSMVGKNISILFGKECFAKVFHKLFTVGFSLFWFGFLAAAAFLCIRDKNYNLLVFSIPFWVVGICFVKIRFLRDKTNQRELSAETGESKFNFPIVMSAILVIAALLTGIVILVLGVMNKSVGQVFAGAFFLFGAFTFVLFALLLRGFFDKLKVDVLGIYMGVLIAAVGIGFIALKYMGTCSIEKTIEAFGLWIIIPILMIAAGVLNVIKCLKNPQKKQ